MRPQTHTPEHDIDRAIAEHQRGRLAQAEAIYRNVLRVEPHNADAMHLLGLLACDRGNATEALAWVQTALDQDEARAAFHNTKARALVLLDRLTEAEAAYHAAWRLKPGSAEIANNLGCLLRGRGEAGAAVEWFWRASAVAPGSADIAVNLALALQTNGAHAASLMQFQHALLLRPDSADIHYQLGHLQLVLGHLGAAERSFRASLRRRPNHAASTINLGIALERQGRGESAAQCFRDALGCDPRNADAHYNLGCMLQLDNLGEEARAQHERAITLAPLHGRARWAACMAELPLLYENAAQIGQSRARYTTALAALADTASDPARAAALADTIGSSQPFFLPYQGECDRDLQQLYGALLTRLVGRDARIILADRPAEGQTLRLGFVSGHACEHTVWRLMLKGWLSQIDRTRFSVSLYDTGTVTDAQTAIARQLADHYMRGTLPQVRARLIADRPHVLIYPELGMDPVCARLAVERFAPVQCVAWGQPQTSGLPSIDYFLSSAAMEPDGASLHYTEQLVCLPHLGVHPMLQEVETAPCGRAQFGLRDDATAFWCGQAIYKYLPHHDTVFARIAASLPNSQFLFIGFARSRIATAQFRARLAASFAALGLDEAAHCVFVDSLDQSMFRASVAACDIVLDSIGWSGGKSTLDMLAEAPVIVTHEGQLMRARHTAAILRCLGVTETIASSIDNYIEIALRLARDPAYRGALRQRIGSARGWLLDDVSPIRALEAFIEQAARHPTNR